MDQNKTKIFRNIAVTLFIAAVIGFTSCEKYIWDPPTYIPPDTTGGFDTIYYGTDVAPLFPSYGCTNCHKSGGFDPHLTTDVSFEVLTGGSYINKDNPPQSLIVTKIDADHMGGMSFDDTKIIIDWIYQGARNFTKQ